MELWIRSQDKERLTKVSEIHLEDTGIDICISDCENDFGRYKTKERALEVLNEIQNNLMNNILLYDEEGYPKLLENISVYEMPQE